MATRKETIEFILGQLAPLPVRARAMFGGHAFYCDEKVVALIGDDTLFVKPTAATVELFGDGEMAPPYPGAKDYYVVAEDRLHDATWLQDVISRTADELPMPKKKAQK